MAYPTKPDISVNPGSLRTLYALSPARSLLSLFADWLIIVLAIALHIRYPYPVLYFIVWLVVGTRMYALYSLLHDGMHYLIYPQKQVNDWLCKLFMAWPLFLPLSTIRNAHMAHHKHLKTENDPEAVHLQYHEFVFPKPALSMAFIFLKDLTGINFIYYKFKKAAWLVKNKNFKEAGSDTGMLFYYIIIFAGFFLMGWGDKLILYWFVPYVSIYQALKRLRLSTEHFHIPADRLFQTRTVKPGSIEKFIFSPHNLGYHAEHHLYPGVPFYRLPDLHKLLMEAPGFESNTVISSSYLTVIKEYIKQT